MKIFQAIFERVGIFTGKSIISQGKSGKKSAEKLQLLYFFCPQGRVVFVANVAACLLLHS